MLQIVSDPSPRLAVVMPIFKHSVLSVDAIRSVLLQKAEIPYVCVLVNDGCPHRETELMGLSFQAAYPDRVVYLRRSNGGLSAARNTGIDWVMENRPTVEAIYFLDADNQLMDHALGSFERALEGHPEADWFYPDFDMIGLEQNFSTAGAYSLLAHTQLNLCEAGSLVRRRVFEKGIRFDESMRLGYEDWEFWIQAGRAGFRGRHLPDFGFMYRKRPESMLANSHRDDSAIRNYMRHKHEWLFNVNTLIQLEHKERPRYAIYLVDTGRVLLAVDPLHPTAELDFSGYENLFWEWSISEAEFSPGCFAVWMSSGTFQALSQRGLLHFVLWDLERRAEIANFAGVEIKEVDTPQLVWFEPDKNDTHLGFTVVMATVSILSQIMGDPKDVWIRSLAAEIPQPSLSRQVIGVPDTWEWGGATAGSDLIYWVIATILKLREHKFRASASRNWNWRTRGLPPTSQSMSLVRAGADGGVVFPKMKLGQGLDVGFAAPVFDFGGVERVAVAVAREFKRAGHRVHLISFSRRPIHLTSEMEGVFDSFLWYPDSALEDWNSGAAYSGTTLPKWAMQGRKADAIGLLSWLDVLINNHSLDFHGVAGELRRRGVVTVSHEHVVERTERGRPFGPPFLVTAYEHAYDVIATCSQELAGWLHGAGVAEEKLLPVPNAAGYTLAESDRQRIQETRERAPDRSKLRALFVGRFDAQKGLDRLIEIIRATSVPGGSVDWRIIGKSIVHAGEQIEFPSSVDLCGPCYDSDELTAHFAWADILVLPSRYEGLPLVIIEAMRCGVIVVAADAGAVREVIAHGEDGFIVSQNGCVDETIQILENLSSDATLRRRISRAAAQTQRSWEVSVSPLIERVAKLSAKKKKTQDESDLVQSAVG